MLLEGTPDGIVIRLVSRNNDDRYVKSPAEPSRVDEVESCKGGA